MIGFADPLLALFQAILLGFRLPLTSAIKYGNGYYLIPDSREGYRTPP
jgi:hypothetical protein